MSGPLQFQGSEMLCSALWCTPAFCRIYPARICVRKIPIRHPFFLIFEPMWSDLTDLHWESHHLSIQAISLVAQHKMYTPFKAAV
jgi:hypothetical protein